jgi:hypothetical protein
MKVPRALMLMLMLLSGQAFTEQELQAVTHTHKAHLAQRSAV